MPNLTIYNITNYNNVSSSSLRLYENMKTKQFISSLTTRLKRDTQLYNTPFSFWFKI